MLAITSPSALMTVDYMGDSGRYFNDDSAIRMASLTVAPAERNRTVAPVARPTQKTGYKPAKAS